MAGKITIDFERCKGCGLCVTVCPRSEIVISKKSNKKGYFPAVAKNTDCTGCCLCTLICPDAVIEVFRDDNIKAIGPDGSKKKRKLTREQV